MSKALVVVVVVVGLVFELDRASVDREAVRSTRCRLPTLNLMIRSFGKASLAILKASMEFRPYTQVQYND